MPKRVLTSIYLPHAPERVWDVLADFARYAEWNPLNVEAEGEARAGSRVRMRFLNPARHGATIRQTVTVTRAERGRALAWRGHVPLLFTGDHLFDLRREGAGTRLIHSETLSGLIPWRFSEDQIERLFVPAYEACNRALAERLNALENVFPLRLASVR
ncbi:SRPBCC domain-containing protein [Sphingomonas sp. ID1715]|uniref:SRPBCC domain-containing protein n=1 Tax=Sphingomonas sp. ID1715 TaxID=1656898 RepID=UPI0014890C14|nr:SRPBCC domain-containing protein [Sphingomonas sp. ID1715]NNM75872.1 SRPBCC domain-containing protein [Sphingomonas sp. ID1715]